MILLLVGLVPMLVAAATVLSIVSIARFHRNRDRRRSPLTTEMLRQPAQSLRAGLDELNDDISMYLAMALMFPFLVSTMFFADIWLRGVTLSEGRWVMYPVMGLVATVYFSMKTVSLGTQKRKFLQAIDAELVVAQELEVLRALGCRIFHDLQCGEFNIDHVVIGKGGVFAVETKSRLKPEKGGGKEAASVRYDGKVLHFPGWVEAKPLQQAERQARWLEQKLGKATGEPVKVRGVLALPGWFVTLQARGDVSVINPKKPDWMAKPMGESRLDDAQVQRIAYQLEQMSIVEPASKQMALRQSGPAGNRSPSV